MTSMYLAVAVLAIINIAFKAVGPAILGDHEFSPGTQSVLNALPVALLGGLITVDLLGPKWGDADWTMLPGLATIAIMRLRHAPDLVCILVGVAVTAGLRALT
ncbi:MAG TPA: AzlD domain-containing protein [Kineosporiaceae bacterium]|nr:AzlD domain-containing protein [Kineosporiaceae bacterium]